MRVASRNATRVPASSVMTIVATGPRWVPDKSGCLMVEPLSATLPGNLILISTLTAAHPGRYPVRVVNVGTKDAWVKPGTWIGLLQEVGVETDGNIGFHEPCPGSIEVTCGYHASGGHSHGPSRQKWRTCTIDPQYKLTYQRWEMNAQRKSGRASLICSTSTEPSLQKMGMTWGLHSPSNTRSGLKMRSQ